jgi:hypothetical protein
MSIDTAAAAARHRAMFDDLARRRRLDDRQKAFLARRLEERRLATGAGDADDAQEPLNRFLDDQIRECREAAILFGASTEEGTARRGSPSGDGLDGGGDLTDPACNPLIPAGAE